jgi:uncharacterized protein
MNSSNKAILEKANAAITRGDHEGFLAFCTEDTEWTFVGERILRGKQAVREYMQVAYATPPKFVVENMISEGEFLTAVGKISLQDGDGEMIDYAYCDVWRFDNGKMAELKAFVIKLP